LAAARRFDRAPVEVPAGYSLVFHSGLTPTPANDKAEKGSPAYWGDTKTQALAVFGRMKESLDSLGLGFGDVVSMTAYLVSDPATEGRMDFAGFMAAYAILRHQDQPNLPSRSTQCGWPAAARHARRNRSNAGAPAEEIGATRCR
jgi:enamine deaminase RidA (YjgF/YER057c/UK114 family)